MNREWVSARAGDMGRWAMVVLGLSIPISVALDNILMAFVVIFWLSSGDLRGKVAAVRDNPVGVAALLLFGLLLAGTAHGSGTAGGLGKYIDLLFVPFFLCFFRAADIRKKALLMFCAAALASVLVSHLASMNLLANNPWLPRGAENPVGFKYSITHSLIVAFAAYLFALLAREEENRARRLVCIALALLAAHNVVFMVIGRTGYLVLTILFVYFFVVTFGRRGLAFIAAIAIATFAAAYATSGSFQQRLDTAAAEARSWEPGKPSDSSVGLRLEFYQTSLEIVREHPLIGSGTGSFPAAYASAVAGRNMVVTDNPHNEYLLIAVQIGLVGLASLLYLFYRQWRLAGQLVEPFYRDLGRGLVLMFVIGCLFNSLLLDHTEGLLFAWLSGLVFSAPRRLEQPAGYAA